MKKRKTIDLARAEDPLHAKKDFGQTSDCSPGFDLPIVETFGEVLPGLLLESVVNYDQPHSLLLHSWDGRRAYTGRELRHAGIAYSPRTVPRDFLRLMRFPTPSIPFGSTKDLVSSVRKFVVTYLHLRPEAAELLVGFVLASWFSDCMSVAPVLHLFGPDSAISQVMRVLACLCRRALLLADVDLNGLASLPAGLGATLLINQRNLSQRVRRTLTASNRRHFSIVRGSRFLSLYGAKVFSCNDSLVDERGIRLSIPPAQDPMPSLSDETVALVACDLQARLLRYRMVRYETVRTSKVDCSAFVPDLREEAASWLAPIVDCDELSASVFGAILQQSREFASSAFFDPKCVVTEAALSLCHKNNVTHFLVGELSERVNVLLKARHEETMISAKKVGLLLRDLGIYGERVAQGYKIALSDDIRRHIHQLASDYQVLSVRDGVDRCGCCRSADSPSEPVQ